MQTSSMLKTGFSDAHPSRFSFVFSLFIKGITGLMLLSSCQQEKPSSLLELNLIDRLSDAQTISTDDISTGLKLVPLETREDVLIKDISKVILTDDLLVILSGSHCMLFDPDGKYIRTVGAVGQGPEEYLYANNVYLSGDELRVFDGGNHRVLTYKTSGEFVKAVRIPADVADILPGNGYMIGHVANRNGHEVNRLKRMDLTGTVLDSLPARQYEGSGIIMAFYPEASMYSFEGNSVLKEICNDTIYTITPDFKQQPRYYLDLGEYAAKAEERYLLADPRMNPFENKRTITNLYESSRYLFFYGWGDAGKVFIYDKKEDVLTYNRIDYSPDMKKRFDKDCFVPCFISEDHSILITSEQPADIDDDSNPVLVLLTLKK